MKKVYSSKAGTTVYALTPEQLSVFQEAGYQTPTPEQVIADAANIQLTPPEGARALVVFNFKSGIFSVRVKTLLLAPGETSGFVGELIAADVLRQMAQQADPDRYKPVTQHTTAAAPVPLTSEPTGPAIGPENPAAAAGEALFTAPAADQSARAGIESAISDMFKTALLNAFNKSTEKAAGNVRTPTAQASAGPEVAE